MVQFRRLDPLANASPYQRLMKSPVKSFTLTEAQYERLSARRPELLVSEAGAAVIGLPNRDYIEIHYAFPEVEAFRDQFSDLFNRIIAASSRREAPRGVLLAFRDRPNRNLAEVVFWKLALEEGPQWVEMNHFAVPEQPEPADSIGDGFRVREASESDRDAIVAIEAEATGRQLLSPEGAVSIFENARWLRVVTDPGGSPVAFVSLRSEPGGWGIIDEMRIRPGVDLGLQRALIDWSIAFLRNNGGRRIRTLVYVNDGSGLSLLREMGFTPGETGLDYTRAVDQAEIQTKIDERQAHGTLIKFGDWR